MNERSVFPLGLGTSRLPITGVNDEAGIGHSIEMILCALDAGVRYIDTADSYSHGMAHEVLRRVFMQTDKPFSVTIKSRYGADKTADDARRQAECSLRTMGIAKAEWFVCWSIMDYGEFEAVMQRGGIYEGASRLRDESIIEHIGLSSHASPEETIKMLEYGGFEAITVSYSLLNSFTMRPVLDAALRHNVDVVVMNPLGGGVIPQNDDFFSFSRFSLEETVAQAALRYAKAHPAVKTVLSGVGALEQLKENIVALKCDPEPFERRLERVSVAMGKMEGYCTGCRYCEGCPVNIPIPAFMQSNNAALFKPTSAYNRTEPDLLRDIQVLRKLAMDFQVLPGDTENPCTRCGRCESLCTQRLPVMDTLETVYAIMKRRGFSNAARKERLNKLLNGKNYKKVGFYPGAGYTGEVLKIYRRFFGEPSFEVVFFDGNAAMWGRMNGGIPVYAPADIDRLKPDAILISNFIFQDEIYNQINSFDDKGIKILKLHEPNDVPWVF